MSRRSHFGLVLVLALLCCASPISLAEPARESRLGITLTAPDDWSLGTDSTDPTVAFWLRSPDKASSIAVYVEEAPGRTLRGVWTGLRYSVVVSLGGRILSDRATRVGDVPARELVFDTWDQDGAAVRHLRVVALKRQRLLTLHCRAPVGRYPGLLESARQIIDSLSWQDESLLSEPSAVPEPEPSDTPEPDPPTAPEPEPATEEGPLP